MCDDVTSSNDVTTWDDVIKGDAAMAQFCDVTALEEARNYFIAVHAFHTATGQTALDCHVLSFCHIVIIFQLPRISNTTFDFRSILIFSYDF